MLIGRKWENRLWWGGAESAGRMAQPEGEGGSRRRRVEAGSRRAPDLAMSHRTQAVRVLLPAGMPIATRGELGATALHWACWKGYAHLVALLLDDAPLAIEDDRFHATPPGWFGHGVRNCQEGGGDYPGVARLLIAAGATISRMDLPTGDPGVDGVLLENGLI